MFRQCTLITFAAKADEAMRDSLADRLDGLARADDAVIQHRLSRSVPGGANGGDLVWHLHFRDEAGWSASPLRLLAARLASDAAIDHVDGCAYRPAGTHVRDPAIEHPIYRALFLAVSPGAAPDRIARFERDVAAMPDYISEIRNWALSRVEEPHGSRRWTHVWEQEFRSIDDLRVAYMANPYHWGHVDRWFDPEHHDFIVDSRLCHSASMLEGSVIALYGAAGAFRGEVVEA